MLIMLMACVDPSPSDPGGIDDPIDVTDPIGTIDPGDDPVDTPDETPDETPGTVTETPVDDIPDWDGSAPDGPEGMEIHAVITCSLFLEPVAVTFVRTADDWLWDIVLDDGGGMRVPGLQPCYPADGGEMPVLLWDDAPLITIISDGMVHTLEQTMRAGFWAGTVAPIAESTAECDAALADLDLAWPVEFTMTML
jgi:hypothetical protein